MDNQLTDDAKTLGHEPIGANTRAIGQSGAALAAVVVVAFLITAGLMKFYSAVEPVSPGGPESGKVPMSPGFPELNPNQPVELQNLREREQRMLDGYGWTDRAAGVARIPIREAIKIIAAEGLPETPLPRNQSSESGRSNRP
jgi:hypothetical protein